LRIGIELVQIHPQQSGGCLQLLQGVLPHLFHLGAHDQFFLYCSPAGWQPAGRYPANVTVTVLDLGGYWYHTVGAAAAADRLDVLFRPYPADAPVTFPPERLLVLVPDLQHEMMPECFSAAVLAQRRAAFGPAITQAGAVAVLAEHGRRLLEERYPQRYGDVFLLPPASPLDESVLNTPLAPADEARLPRQPYFLFPANLWPHKNHRRLIEAFARFRAGRTDDTALVFTGDPAPWPELSRLCGDLPVYHLGYVGLRLLAELYRRAVALVYFSLFEGFGIPLLEAFHLGTPVLCGNTTTLPEIGGEAVLTCDPTDVGAMAELMARVAGNRGLREELVAAGRRRIGRYRWEDSARNLHDACRRVAARPARHESTLATLESIYRSYQGEGGLVTQQHQDIVSLKNYLVAEKAEAEQRLRLLHEATAGLRLLEAECAARLDIIHRQVEQLENQAKRVRDMEGTIQALQQQLNQATAPFLTRVRQGLKRLGSMGNPGGAKNAG